MDGIHPTRGRMHVSMDGIHAVPVRNHPLQNDIHAIARRIHVIDGEHELPDSPELCTSSSATYIAARAATSGVAGRRSRTRCGSRSGYWYVTTSCGRLAAVPFSPE